MLTSFAEPPFAFAFAFLFLPEEGPAFISKPSPISSLRHLHKQKPTVGADIWVYRKELGVALTPFPMSSSSNLLNEREEYVQACALTQINTGQQAHT